VRDSPAQTELVERAIGPQYLRFIVERLESLRSHPLGFRVAGTPEERAAVAFVAEELRALGLEVVEEPVPVDAWRLRDAYVEAGRRSYECASFGGVPETGPEGVSGELVVAGRAGQRELEGVAGILRLLDGLRDGGLGILMITHDLSTEARFSDRIAVMYLGRIVEEGPAREVVRNPQHPYRRALLSVVPKRDPRDRQRPQILRGEAPDAVRIPPGCRFHPRCPLAIDACRAQDPPLGRPAAATNDGHVAACILA
jgi:oligopeptide/dipeptide ABC transporter ATP-binding protein